MIPVKNVYHMLAYAFSALRSQGYRDLSTEDFDNAADLLSAILARGIDQQVRCGLPRGYIECTQTTPSPRGKIDISESVKRATFINRKLACSYDEFSLDVYSNRILKTAGVLLLKTSVGDRYRRSLRRSLVYFQDVATLDPREIDWRQCFERGGQTYRMLLNISRMAIEGCLHCEAEGNKKLEDFIDEKRMSALFERFILEYFKKEHDDLVFAGSPHIPWALDRGNDDLLPVMRTDITLRGRGMDCVNTLIIDAKYYSLNMQLYFDRRTVHSGNLYQIFAYVKNEQERLNREGLSQTVSGMLLYARTQDEIQPDATYLMSGNEITVKVLDLNLDFVDIAAQLDAIAQEYFVGRGCSV